MPKTITSVRLNKARTPERFRNLNPLRARICEILGRRRVDIVFPVAHDADRDPHFVLTPAIKRGTGRDQIKLPWKQLRAVPMFASTSKMGCVSWSIPAGSITTGGSCPAAEAMLATAYVAPQKQVRAKQKLQMWIGEPLRQDSLKGEVTRQKVVRAKTEFICDGCYAGRGNYGNPNVQLFQTLRYIWALQALADGSFVDTMVAAIQETMKATWTRFKLEEDVRFFRIHDSGDYFSVPYAEAWNEVARRLPKIHFWAPTRVWANPGFGPTLARAPKNLAIRPSAIHFGDDAPAIPGLAQGSTAGAAGRASWDCPAMRGVGHSCQGAVNPDCQRGCRVCWVRPDWSVNYGTH